MNAAGGFVRRARPLLGTLVEIGVAGSTAQATIAAAFARIEQLQARLSRFEPGSAIGRFNAPDAGIGLRVDADAQNVLQAAQMLQAATDGGFDISLGSGPQAWALDGDWLQKRKPGTTLDLGGIGKGYAVDCAIALMQARGCSAGWVNAGGDVRAFGDATLTLQLRDETGGGVRAWGRLQDGACATSRFGPGSRSALAGGDGTVRHLSVLAPRCLWADALTKVAALDPGHPSLRAFGAVAWLHR